MEFFVHDTISVEVKLQPDGTTCPDRNSSYNNSLRRQGGGERRGRADLTAGNISDWLPAQAGKRCGSENNGNVHRAASAKGLRTLPAVCRVATGNTCSSSPQCTDVSR